MGYEADSICCDGGGCKHAREELDALRIEVGEILKAAFQLDNKPHRLFYALERAAGDRDMAETAQVIRDFNNWQDQTRAEVEELKGLLVRAQQVVRFDNKKGRAALSREIATALECVTEEDVRLTLPEKP